MSLVKYWFFRIAIFGVSLFYGGLAVIVLLIRRLISGRDFFSVKERRSLPSCLQDPAHGRHAYIQLKNIKLHYVENGDRSKPLMLFVHGFPEFWFSWRHQMKEFAATHWVVAIDLRGYGDSEKPTEKSAYDIEVVEKDIVEFVKALNRQSCILVAHDWGGVIAWNVAANNPQMVDKLVMMNSPHLSIYREKAKGSIGQFLKSWYVFFLQLPYLPEWAIRFNDLEIFSWIFMNENYKLTMTKDELEAFKYTFSKKGAWTPPINYYRQNLKIEELAGQAKPILRIKVPTLIIWGEDDIALSKDYPELARAYIQDVTVKYIAKGNHYIQQDKVAEVNKHLVDFIL